MKVRKLIKRQKCGASLLDDEDVDNDDDGDDEDVKDEEEDLVSL